MTGAERGFLLLGCHLGDPARRPLTTAQLRKLAQRMRGADMDRQDRDLEPGDLIALGYGREEAARIVGLLEEDFLLDSYLKRAAKLGCVPLTWVTPGYPAVLRKRLGGDAPACLWVRGDPALLEEPMIALVGSRELDPAHTAFAETAGMEAARQSYTLVSGNARGADRTAQDACLENGGRIISVLADRLSDHTPPSNALYLSEEGFDLDFSPQRALSRNRVIHALGECTLVARSGCREGGSWDGSVKNLRFGWSPLFVFQDGSAAAKELVQMGAMPVTRAQLADLSLLMQEVIQPFLT